MRIKLSPFLLSVSLFFSFILLSLSVAKEFWRQIDFDVTVKLQDRISKEYDPFFSYFSLLGSAEVTLGITIAMVIFYLFRFRILAVIGWLMIIPASMVEIVGKLFLFHPGTPVLFHRSVIETQLPSFYIQTNFSYPSGHMTRTTFLVTVFLVLTLFQVKGLFLKTVNILILLIFLFMMVLTRLLLGEHWLSDVIGGGILGASAGTFAAALILSKKMKDIASAGTFV